MHLDLDKLLDENAEIYVVNSTKPKGKFILTFREPNSNVTHPFCVPKTWIPIYVSAAIPRRVIRESIDFREALRKKNLELVDPEEARKILTETEAVAELDRLNRSEFTSNSKFSKQAQALLEATDAKLEETQLKAKELSVEDDEDEDEVSPPVIDICSRVNTKELDVRSALNELKCIANDVTIEDCNYIIANCDGNVRSWAKKQLEDICEEDEE